MGGTQLELTKTISIEANVPITVSANNASRVFNIGASGVVTLTSLTIRDGSVTGNGGGIYNDGNLRLEATRVISNSAQWGGGLYVDSGSGALTMVGGEIRDNSASTAGGLIVYEGSAALTMIGGQVRDNSAANDDGGGLYVNRGSAVLSGTAGD